jgi:hypothetical protein
MGTHGATVLMIAASKGYMGILRVLETEGGANVGISTMTDVQQHLRNNLSSEIQKNISELKSYNSNNRQ